MKIGEWGLSALCINKHREVRSILIGELGISLAKQIITEHRGKSSHTEVANKQTWRRLETLAIIDRLFGVEFIENLRGGAKQCVSDHKS